MLRDMAACEFFQEFCSCWSPLISILQGYKSKNEYIVTQMPLPHTVIDLWRMIFEHNVGSIVMLNPWDPNNEVTFSSSFHSSP